MLPRDEPYRLAADSDPKRVDQLSIQRPAERSIGDTRMRGDAGHEGVVPFHGIGSEVGEPGEAAGALPVEREHAVGVAGRDHPPCRAVDARAHLVVVPAAGKGCAAGVDDAQVRRAWSGSDQAEEEPLVEGRVPVVPDGKIDGVAADLHDVDVAAVERGIDGKGHPAS